MLNFPTFDLQNLSKTGSNDSVLIL